jgi:aspartate carbamoyltransferase catalytic subunit
MIPPPARHDRPRPRGVTAILDTAEELKDIALRPIKKVPTLRGRTVCNLFYEDSTRTRISFELAAKRLSADVLNFSAKGSSVSKGESLKDTALTLQAMGVDAIVIRHSMSGAPLNLTRWVDAVVLNAGDGWHQHPTQALLDLFTIRERSAASRGCGSPSSATSSTRGSPAASCRASR